MFPPPTDLFFEMVILSSVLDLLGKLEDVLERLQLSERLRLVLQPKLSKLFNDVISMAPRHSA
jgi:hypothetical protein